MKFNKFKKQEKKTYTLVLNELELDKLVITSYQLHSTTMGILKEFTMPQYEKGWLLRNKRGFNTYLLKINYDILVCDRFGNVLDTFISCEPGYISKHYENGYFIYYLNVGTIKHFEIKKSDRVTLKRDLVKAKIAADALGLG